MAAQQRDLSKATGGEPEAVRIWLLGDFRISVGTSRSIADDGWRLRKAGTLIKLLALASDHRLHREQATVLLWPDLDPQAATNNLHHALYVARHTLEPSSPSRAVSSYLQLRDERLALCPDGPLWVDVGAFEEAAITARHGREAAAYRAALDLYSGELLPRDRYETWVEQRRSELRELYLSLLVELAALYEERGEYEPAIEALNEVVAKEPKHEDAHVGLMRLYALSGRRREALGQYERLREALYRELGTEPEATSTLLQQEIWTGAFPPALLPPASSPPQETPSATGVVRHNLPRARDTFVGRERETHEVRRLLAMTGLLTLTGSGGSGKTRLALEVASGLVGAYPDGVWLVELAALSEAAPRSCRAGQQLDRNVSGIGIALLGAREMEVTGNQISGNVPSGPTLISGGVVVAVTPYFQDEPKPRNNTVTGNDFGRNKPDIFWDGTGTGNVLQPNNCNTSVPSRLCN